LIHSWAPSLRRKGWRRERVKEELVFFKAEKRRRKKGWFEKSFSNRKMKEGVGFEILRRKS